MNETRPDTARLRWRSRRGVKELDVLMEQFVAERLPRLSADHLRVLDQLLDESDMDLLDWIVGRTAPRPEYVQLVEMLRSVKEVKS